MAECIILLKVETYYSMILQGLEQELVSLVTNSSVQLQTM